MKTKVLFLILILSITLGFSQTQTSTNEQIQQLEQQKKDYEMEQKRMLSSEVEIINQKMEKGEITAEEAAIEKYKVARTRAENIRGNSVIIDEKIKMLERGQNIYVMSERDTLIRIKIDKKHKKYKPTRHHFSFAMGFGLNNVLYNGSLNDSPYKVWGSRFFEIGLEGVSRISKEGNLNIRYAFLFQFNGLKPKANATFITTTDGKSLLKEYPYYLKKSKFRMDNLIFPISLEYGIGKSFENRVSIGAGGFVGLNLNAIQKLKYVKDDNTHKEKLSGDYNTQNFLYGVNAYVKYRRVGLFVRYNLNSIFKNNPNRENNISFGICL